MLIGTLDNAGIHAWPYVGYEDPTAATWEHDDYGF
jgi:hypothetical protein